MAETDPLVVVRRIFFSHSTEATEAFGAALGRAIEAQSEFVRSGVALSLEGELGSGKTAVVRGVARGLGAAERVHSPSFTLMHTYEGRLPIFHFDAWMEGRERAFLDGGGAEWLDGGGVALIEWASRVESWLPLPRLGLLLEHMGSRDPDRRRLTLSALVARGGSLVEPRALAMEQLVRGLLVADDRASPGIIEEP